MLDIRVPLLLVPRQTLGLPATAPLPGFDQGPGPHGPIGIRCPVVYSQCLQAGLDERVGAVVVPIHPKHTHTLTHTHTEVTVAK